MSFTVSSSVVHNIMSYLSTTQFEDMEIGLDHLSNKYQPESSHALQLFSRPTEMSDHIFLQPNGVSFA